MAASLTDSNNDPFSVLGMDTSAQRTQIAQYSIMRAATYLQSNKNDSALKEFKKALAFDPQNSTALTYIGKINLSQGNNSEAIKAFKTLVQLQPSSADAHINLANAYIQDKQYNNSEKELKMAARLDPTNPLPDYTLGLQYTNTGRLSEAETQFLKVKKISRNDGNVYYALGTLYNKQGKYDAAVTNLEKATQLKKSFPEANYELGAAYNALGRTDDAQKQLVLLQKMNAPQATELKTLLTKPGMVYMDSTDSGGFTELLGRGTNLLSLATPEELAGTNPLAVAGGSKIYKIKIAFNSDMNVASVTNPQNWSISRSTSGDGGVYMKSADLSAKDVVLPNNPEAIMYNPYTMEATISFRLTQNSTKDAVIDPSHIVFKFSGTDVSGKKMDITKDQIDGAAGGAF